MKTIDFAFKQLLRAERDLEMAENRSGVTDEELVNLNDKVRHFILICKCLERNIAKSPKWNSFEGWHECPECGGIVRGWKSDYMDEYCPDCGQAIDWS